jgi:hypothetical protein
MYNKDIFIFILLIYICISFFMLSLFLHYDVSSTTLQIYVRLLYIFHEGNMEGQVATTFAQENKNLLKAV